MKPSRPPLAYLLTSLLLAATVAACEPGDQSSAAPLSDDISVELEKYTLPNGLEVILSEDHRLPMVAVNVWYHVGPANEEAGRTGFAHLFEHMMFQGSKHVQGDSHFRLLEGAGASGINGSTSFDRTNYYETVPADQLELALWLESDRMGYMIDELDQAKLSNQQDVVRNERRQTLENQPFGIVQEALYHELFPQGHPYYADVIGSHADIQAARLDDVREFFKVYYAPNNATIVIVGDFDPEDAKALIEKYFGTLRGGDPVGRPEVATPPITSERRITVTDRVELPRVYMAWLTPVAFQPGDADAQIAASILSGGRSSRLYQSLVYDQEIAQDVRASQGSYELQSVFTISATARPGHTLDELEQAIDAELERMRAELPDLSEVERARNTIETRMVSGIERFGGLADRLNRYNHYVGDPGYLDDDFQRYEAVTPASVQAFVQRYLTTESRVVVDGVPGEPQLAPPVPTPPMPDTAQSAPTESVNADEPWRNEVPAGGEARAAVLPTPESFQLPNGLTVLVNERPGLPIVSASLAFRAGDGENPGDRSGLASFTGSMLDEGTSTRNALQIAEEVSQLGASLSIGTSMDATRISALSLRRTFPELLEILADVAQNPTFPSEEVERQRTSRLTSVEQQADNPSTVAANTLFSVLYGPANAYGYGDLGTAESLRAITRDDMQAFWADHLTPENAVLAVSGQITAANLRPMVEELFSAWPRGSAAASPGGDIAPTDARLVLVDRPGAQQTQLRVGSIGVSRATPDYEAVLVLNEALGGMFSSRINLNLREEHGYTYGANSQFVFRRSAGPFYVGSGVRTDVTAPSVTEIFREIRRIREEPLTPDELALARDSQVRSLSALFETSSNVTGIATNLFIYDLGLDYYSTLGGRLSALTAQDVQEAAQRHLDPDAMVVVAVGDLSRIRPSLEALNLGREEERLADGTVMR